jgi:hypothetical protein
MQRVLSKVITNAYDSEKIQPACTKKWSLCVESADPIKQEERTITSKPSSFLAYLDISPRAVTIGDQVSGKTHADCCETLYSDACTNAISWTVQTGRKRKRNSMVSTP